MNEPTNALSVDNPRLNPHWTDSRYYGLLKLRQTLEKLIATHVVPLHNSQPNLVAVDLGCGTMPYRSLFTPFVSRYLGADLPTNQLADLPIDAQTGRVDIAASSVHLVISTQVLEHVESPAAYLTEASRICQPNGLLILSTHGFWPYHPHPTDYWRWTGSGLCKLLRDQGWQPIEIGGVLGFAATSVCLFQDALSPKIPSLLRGAFTVCLQQVVGFLDRFYSSEGRQENAAVYLVVASRDSKTSI